METVRGQCCEAHADKRAWAEAISLRSFDVKMVFSTVEGGIKKGDAM